VAFAEVRKARQGGIGNNTIRYDSQIKIWLGQVGLYFIRIVKVGIY